ncbi:transposase family protein [Kineosporia babensis]|uniref:Transposase family protein n=1 Tax=Kineosporia babensis TaxID=499548 RepID=A0A9X1NNB8_9ACTN|nr:transposase family protein [Kineosporia babensis]MCD5317270.1 transposase family protein [Kineosporia babensis]
MSSTRTALVPAALPAPIPAARSLIEVFAQVSDPRARRGVRHQVCAVLAAGLAATLGGARSFAATAQWAAESEAGLLRQLGLPERPQKRRSAGSLPARTPISWTRCWASSFTPAQHLWADAG